MKRSEFLKKSLMAGLGLTIIHPTYPRINPRILEEQKSASWTLLGHFIVSVAIAVTTHVIKKWLDRNDEDGEKVLTGFSRHAAKENIAQLSGASAFNFDDSKAMRTEKSHVFSDFLYEAQAKPEIGHVDNRLIYVVNEPYLHVKPIMYGYNMIEVGALGMLAEKTQGDLSKQSFLPLIGVRKGVMDGMLRYQSRDGKYDVTIIAEPASRSSKTKYVATITLSPRNGGKALRESFLVEC